MDALLGQPAHLREHLRPLSVSAAVGCLGAGAQEPSIAPFAMWRGRPTMNWKLTRLTGGGTLGAVMSNAAQAVIEAFEHLSEAEREEVFRKLLRRAAEVEYEAFTDEELVAAGRDLFLSLDAQDHPK